MVICPYGAQPRPDAPEQFQFEEDFILSFLEHVPLAEAAAAAFLTQIGLQLPSGAQNTADFVAHEPTGDLPTTADWVSIFFPPSGFLTGAYERIGRWIRLAKWKELAVCNVNPNPPDDGGNALCRLDLPGQPGSELADNCGPFSGYDWYDLVDAGSTVVSGHEWGAQITISDARAMAYVDTHIGWVQAGHSWGELPYDRATQPGAWVPRTPGGEVVFNAWWQDTGDSPPLSVHLDVYGRVNTVPTVPVLPPNGPPEPPPPGADCGDCTDAVRALSAKLDFLTALVAYIARSGLPPNVVADQDGTPIPSGGGHVSRPPDAVGVIVEVTSVPAESPHYGTDPVFWPDLGHVAFVTADGPLPSQLLKHNPLVLLSIPYPVSALAFDLRAGVAGQVRWLRNQP